MTFIMRNIPKPTVCHHNRAAMSPSSKDQIMWIPTEIFDRLEWTQFPCNNSAAALLESDIRWGFGQQQLCSFEKKVWFTLNLICNLKASNYDVAMKQLSQKKKLQHRTLSLTQKRSHHLLLLLSSPNQLGLSFFVSTAAAPWNDLWLNKLPTFSTMILQSYTISLLFYWPVI